MENVRETTNERMNGEEKTEEERGREDGRGERRGGERERDALARKEQRDGCRGRGVTEGQRKLVPDPI